MSAKYTGFSGLEELLLQMAKEFGAVETRKNVLIPAARKSFKTVLDAAKNNLYPGHGYDTGQLKRTLKISARAVKGKDLRSKYVNPGDVVIATVSAKLEKKHIKTKTGIKNIGDVSDARAIALEFGTANMAAKPYLRPALEANYQTVTETLKIELAKSFEQYKAKKQSEA
jgi:HK97 gp10 family phage protein